jgi:predicted Zn-dependent protease
MIPMVVCISNCFTRSRLSGVLLTKAMWGVLVTACLGLFNATAWAELPPAMILNRVLAANGISPQVVNDVRIENSTALNAYTNGKDIVLSSALWRGLPSEDERAFVIAHEAAHIVLQHIQKTQVRRVGLSLFDRYLQTRVTQRAAALLDVGLQLVDRRFSRDVEYQADDLGLQLMRKAAYNPNAALGVFRFLGQANQNGRTPEFLSTHPISQSRIRNLVNKYQLQNTSN